MITDHQTDLHPFGGPFEPGRFPFGPEPETFRRRPSRKGRLRMVVAVVAAAMVVIAGGTLVDHGLWRLGPSRAPTQSTYPYGTGEGLNGSTSPGAPANASVLAASTNPALVDITVKLPYQGSQAGATGMVLSGNGEVLTNNHVIQGAGTISVTDVGTGKSYTASVIGYSRSDDVAVLRLSNASGLQTVAVGDSSKVAVGDGVVAVGNALGRGGTPTWSAGSITATDQTVTAHDQSNGTSETLTGLLETNAAIVSGDSGGALVAASGKVIGMITAGSTGFRFQESYGFAIPINTALSLARQIEAGRSSPRVHVGPTAFLGVDVRSPISGTGAEITGLVSGGPAARAGLALGDTLVAVAGTTLAAPEDLTGVLISQKPGAAVSVQYLDAAGRPHTLTVLLGSGPPQ